MMVIDGCVCRGAHWRAVALASLLWSAGCALPPAQAPGPIAMSGAEPARHAGRLEVYLEPYDGRSQCSATIGLHNLSADRQGEAWLRLTWFNAAGTRIADQRLRLDPLLPGRFDAKNLVIGQRCRDIGRLRVTAADWLPYPGDDDTGRRSLVVIDGVLDSEWRLRWDEDKQLFVGEAAAG